MPPSAPDITVCICTYRRPDLLKRLLDELARQETGGGFTFSVVVTDNDRLESARPVAVAAAAAFPEGVTYCVEPRQNIALARNQALAHARGDYVAFIDDDEFPAPGWLETLFQARQRFGSDGVLGPVKPHFDQAPPSWLIKGGFFDRPTHPTGHVLDWEHCRTGNVLLKRSVMPADEPPFRPEFAGGGEDRNFFHRMIDAGHVFVWCDEAVAYEVVPPARWKRRVLLRRALLRGKMALNQPGGRTRGLAVSLVAVPLYAVALPFLALAGQHRLMKGLIKLCDHAGRVLAFVGLNPVREVYVTEP